MSARVHHLSPDGPAIGTTADIVELSYAEGAEDADWIGAFAGESNRGRHVWFVADEPKLQRRLG